MTREHGGGEVTRGWEGGGEQGTWGRGDEGTWGREGDHGSHTLSFLLCKVWT